MKHGRWTYIVISTLLGSCVSTSAHYYTLVSEPEQSAPAMVAVPFRLEIGSIPAQVDRSELVIRLPDGRMAIVDSERWIAPVGDELQNALSVELLRRLGAISPSEPTGPRSLLIRLNLDRFESSPYRYALVEASWHLALKSPAYNVSVVCRSRAYEQVTGSYPDLVRGYQRAVAAVASEIATIAQESMRGLPAECPGPT
jgi:uncharacterized lipoprotein YmbA